MKTYILFLLFIAISIFNSCNFKQEEKQGYSQVSGDAAEMEVLKSPPAERIEKYTPPIIVENEVTVGSNNSETETLGNASTVHKKKIIKDGSISVKTNDINASKKGIDELLKKLNAYYEKEDLQNNDQTISFDLKIRVPANNFEKLIESIENGKDEIKSKSIQARDVTEEYVDIETRLTNKREYLKRYKELLSKASTVKDIITIEENIRTLQEEIESKEGRLKYLNDQIMFSTLDLNLFKDKEFVYKPEPQDKFSERVKNSISNGWTSVVDFALWSITIWPYYILALIVFFVYRRIVKRRKNRQS